MNPIQNKLLVFQQDKALSNEDMASLLDFPSYSQVLDTKADIPGELLAKLTAKFNLNPLWLYDLSDEMFLAHDILPKTIVLNEEGEETILLVHEKALAGYPAHLQDKDWYEDLAQMKLPFPAFKKRSHRGFQISGYSMYPTLHPEDWVIGRALSSLAEISSNQMYIVVLQDSVLVKELILQENTAVLRSVNPEFEDIRISLSEIKELWQVVSRLSFQASVSADYGLRKELKDSMSYFLKS